MKIDIHMLYPIFLIEKGERFSSSTLPRLGGQTHHHSRSVNQKINYQYSTLFYTLYTITPHRVDTLDTTQESI